MTVVLPRERAQARPPAQRPPPEPVRQPGLTDYLADWVSRNRLFTAALATAAVLRLLVMIAYRPALEFFGDSVDYLRAASHLTQIDVWHPPGYPVLIRLVSVTHSLTALVAVQHLLALATGVLTYRLLRRYGAGPVAGTLAAAPVLFDAYQLDVEQFVLSEALFTFLLVAGLALCLRTIRAPRTSRAVGVGLLLAAATLTRDVGLVVIVPVLLAMLAARIGWRRVVATAVAFAVPVLSYAGAFRGTYGVWGLGGYSGTNLYGTVAPIAQCGGLHVPRVERVLCPTLPNDARPGLNQYVWDSGYLGRLPGNSFERDRLAGAFAHDVALHQPAAFVATVMGDLVHYAAPGRGVTPRDWWVGSWQFPSRTVAPAWHISPAVVGYNGVTRVTGHIARGLSTVLRGYQRVVFTPGPLLALLAAAVLAAAATRRRDGPRRVAAGLLCSSGVLLLLVPSISAGFDWRYLLPAQALLVPGGVLAVTVLRRHLSAWARPVVTAVLAAAAVVGIAVPSGALVSEPSTRTATTPSTLPIGDRAWLHVGVPVLQTTGCGETRDGLRRFAVAGFPIAGRYRSGGPLLIQPDSFLPESLRPGGRLPDEGGNLAGSVRLGHHTLYSFAPVLLSRAYRSTAGMLYADLYATRGRLRYVDPEGAGAAAWTYRLSIPPGGRVIGARCPSPAPIRFVDLPSFTEASSLPIRFQLIKPTSPATVDLRWRSTGAWISPPTWRALPLSQYATISGLAPGRTYCFAARANTRSGVSLWTPPSCTTRLLAATESLPSAGWQGFTGRAGFYLGSFALASSAGATLTATGAFGRLAVDAYHCARCGVIDVYAGPRRLGVLNLAAPPLNTLVLWTSVALPLHTYTVTLRVASLGRVVAVDGIGMQP